VVSQLVASIEPHAKDRPACPGLPRSLPVDEELALVDEAHAGDTVLADGGQEPARVLADGLDAVGDHRGRRRREVVEGEGDRAISGNSRAAREDGHAHGKEDQPSFRSQLDETSRSRT
jgi:hypothetical protein